MPNPVQSRKALPPLPAKAYRHKSPARLFDGMDERRALGESYEPERKEPQEAYAIKIDVPGCTCAERSQQQLDECDVCEACVRYFELDSVSPPDGAPEGGAADEAERGGETVIEPSEAFAAGGLRFCVWVRTVSEANAREHWNARHARRKRQRKCVKNVLQHFRGAQLPCTVTLTRIAPRKLDDDNAVMALKAVRDEVAAWLGVDDADPRVTWQYAPQKKGRVREYAVEIHVQARRAA